ncbi:hypothetical protein ACFS5L_40910 [Streptomyces phyllanthi]|uniref:Uncharacterized protein n=1 Tax=Streptomyces phyllanthi TaxID=1803180 RepID=A0A5N8W6V7_9ACTN|nr:hypothetical protein [Streptomyces phyllanthi]MPY43019.1 hypothetical protein [Streptomyces phyllanthi]
MTSPPTLTRYRTLIVEGREGVRRSDLLAELAHLGFLVRRMPTSLHHLDPALPYRELLAGPGRLAVDGGILRELVYGPLRRGRSRVTWIQALDFAEAVAERDGAMLHLMARAPAGHTYRLRGEAADASVAYDHAFLTLAQHVPVVTLDVREPARPIRAHPPHEHQLRP